MKMWLIILVLNLPVIAQTVPPRERITADEMEILVSKGSSREISYTNKQAGVFYSETNGNHRSGWQGWRVMSTEILENYSICIDGNRSHPLDASAKAYPHQLVREYPDSVTETFTLLDSIDAFVVELNGLHGKELSINPYFSDSFDPKDYEIDFKQNVLLIAHKNHLVRTQTENYPAWIGIMINGGNNLQSSTIAETLANSFSPANVQWLIANAKLSICFVAGDTRDETISLAQFVSKNYQNLIVQRKKRMEDLLNYSYVRTDNKRFDKALYWAKISLDALIMNQRGKGIFAGLPWFDNYWGRDSFISLAGATLVTGNFKDAKEILRLFAAWQDTNLNSTNYGRIPNLVTANSISYNTADGTPRFIIALDEYVKYSGDTVLMREMYPVMKRSIEGTIKYHMDSLCFLTHGDAETWMDAVGPDGPWSPRGNRANDIQALWYQQLKIGSAWAAQFVNQPFNEWISLSSKLKSNFQKYFVDENTGLAYDHLKNDGVADKQFRPNQLFTWQLLNYTGREKMMDSLTKELVYPYGVASLSQDDANFHPYHRYQPYYVQDAAYHNGVVWTWLAGEWINLITDCGGTNIAFSLTENMVHQILDRGAVGTISELLDAVPRKGEKEPHLSGTYSQAWSLAEFIRSFYQAYLGTQINTDLNDQANNVIWRKDFHTVSLTPHLPESIHRADFNILLDSSKLECQYLNKNDTLDVACKLTSTDGNVRATFFNMPQHPQSKMKSGYISKGIGLNLLPQQEKFIRLSGKVISTGSSRDSLEVVKSNSTIVQKTFCENTHLASPKIRTDLKCLQLPSYRLLKNSEIKQTNPKAKLIYVVTDPEGDDNGTGSYIYPQTINLKQGSLDITRFSISADNKNVYFKLQFKNLSNPGWHPEYGFQLTYTAIAINKGKKEGEKKVGMNSSYTFTNGFTFQNIIYVGGGIRVVDSNGKILAEYLPAPADEKNPLGNVNKKTIEFSIPVELLGKPKKSWCYAVLIGAQDDHGGAGIGEFRNVEVEAKEWVGGGKPNPNDPNVYDVILPK